MYLIYIGFQTIRQPLIQEHDSQFSVSKTASLVTGVLTNALNPKTALFVLSLMTQLMSMQFSIFGLIGFGNFISLMHLIWFSAVAYVFSYPMLRTKILTQQRKLNHVIGSVLVGLGIMLLLNVGLS